METIDKLDVVIEHQVKEKLDEDCETFSEMRIKWFVLGASCGVAIMGIICIIVWELGNGK